jgi:hypothetical protein
VVAFTSMGIGPEGWGGVEAARGWINPSSGSHATKEIARARSVAPFTARECWTGIGRLLRNAKNASAEDKSGILAWRDWNSSTYWLGDLYFRLWRAARWEMTLCWGKNLPSKAVTNSCQELGRGSSVPNQMIADPRSRVATKGTILPSGSPVASK